MYLSSRLRHAPFTPRCDQLPLHRYVILALISLVQVGRIVVNGYFCACVSLLLLPID